MARDRNPLLTVTSDKLAVRGYVAERLGRGYLPELYGVVDWPEQLLDLDLPPRYVVKATHGSGMTAVVTRDSAAERAVGRGPGAQVARSPSTGERTASGAIAASSRGSSSRSSSMAAGAAFPRLEVALLRRARRAGAGGLRPVHRHTRNFYDPDGPARRCSGCTIPRGPRSRSPRASRGCARWPRRSRDGLRLRASGSLRAGGSHRRRRADPLSRPAATSPSIRRSGTPGSAPCGRAQVPVRS